MLTRTQAFCGEIDGLDMSGWSMSEQQSQDMLRGAASNEINRKIVATCVKYAVERNLRKLSMNKESRKLGRFGKT